jgi:hypothetical protein
VALMEMLHTGQHKNNKYRATAPSSRRRRRQHPIEEPLNLRNLNVVIRMLQSLLSAELNVRQPELESRIRFRDDELTFGG